MTGRQRLRRRATARPPVWEGSQRLVDFRTKHNLNKSQMVDFLKSKGLVGLNWATYYGWERGRVTPKPLYASLVLVILAGEPPLSHNGARGHRKRRKKA